MREKPRNITPRVVTKTLFGYDTYELTIKAVYDHRIEIKVVTCYDRPSAQTILAEIAKFTADIEDERR